MKGKVTCTCGWSWNKSDSSKKDMYICHECGRDNSNTNLRNGGWLESYDVPQAQNGIEGTMAGLTDKGFNYNGAWGGQFQEGGEIPNAQKGKPIYVESKNDPRYKAYQDSLDAHTYTKSEYNKTKKTGKIGDLELSLTSEKKLPFDEFIDEYNYNSSTFNLFNSGTNKNMKPQTISRFRGKGILGYLDYGNQALFKKPQQPVIVKDQNAPQRRTINTSDTEGRFELIERPKLQALQNNLQPEGLVQGNMELNADMSGLRPQPRAPRYYDVEDIVNNGKSQTNYQWYPGNNEALRQLSEESGDRRTMVPHYQMGGSLPGSVGFTYARTKGIPSNGPYAKKTMPSAQNGQEMKYYQEGLDWKPKTISRNGGWLDGYEKAQEGYTTGNKVEYGTPEYREAYNKGEVVTDEGVRSPIALDEVVIQNNYKRPRGFWEQYRDKIVEENKDAGVLGAIIGTPISAITSLPQLAMMKGLTGEMQRPSEAMDIENPYGAFAVDVVTDPTNLVGAGILTKEQALAKIANLKNIRNVNAEGKIFSGMNNELNNMAIKNTEKYMAKRAVSEAPLAKELEPSISRIGDPHTGTYTPVQEDEYIKWFNEQKAKMNPSTPVQDPRSILRNSSIIDINDAAPIRKQGFPNPLGIVDRIIPRPPDPAMLVGMEGSWNNLSPLNWIPGYGNKLSATSSHPNFVGFRKFGNSIQDVIESQSLRPKGTGMGSKQIMREGNWAEPGKVNENYSGVFEATMNPQIEGSNIKLEKIHNRNGIVGTTKEGNVAIPLTDPGLSFNRRLPFSNRYVPIDKEKLINNQFQLSTQLPYIQSLAEKYGLWAGGAGAAGYIANGEKGARKNISTINKYTVDPIIDYTKPKLREANKQFQDLLNSTQRQNGGDIIKDDMGYWNPENWDSPVEIGSNEITMEGVPFDVLGISDTGDTKLMKPGKDYKFKGKKVTEFPMAKNGLRQEQKGLVNLDDLTNFTNYNKSQPSGWLSKYE